MTMTIPRTGRFGETPTPSLDFLEHYLNWPEPLAVPESVGGALAVLQQVTERPLRQLPAPSPDEYLGADGDGALDALALEALIAPQRAQAKKLIAVAAENALAGAVRDASEELWAAVDKSFGAAFERLPSVDLELPGRVTGADAALMSAQGRKGIADAIAVEAVVVATSELSSTVVPRQSPVEGDSGYGLLRYVELDYETWRKVKDGLHHVRTNEPLNGDSLMTWVARCGVGASLARSHAQREARYIELDAQIRRQAGERVPSGPRVSGRSRQHVTGGEKPLPQMNTELRR
jgi:hypothetical protein